MKVLITAVGQRTEHWTDLFAELSTQPDLSLSIAVADVSANTESTLQLYAAESRVRYHPLPHVVSEARTGHMASVVIAPSALRRLDADAPDVIHIIGEAAYLSTAQIIRWRNRRWPTVPVTLYAAQNVLIKFPVPFPWLERRAYSRVQHLFPITPAALNVLRGKGYRGRATIVPLGVDTSLFTPERRIGTRRAFTVGFVGRLELHKGIRDLLDAVRHLDCDLRIIGRGSQEPLIQQEAARRPGRVTICDWADHTDLPRMLAAMDVLVLPSVGVIQQNVLPWVGIPLREQFGRVLVEAMSCGIPVIGSDVGEIPYVIGDAGLIFPAGNVDALVDRLARLRDNPSLAVYLGQVGAARARLEFGWASVTQQMHRVWAGMTPLQEPIPRQMVRPSSPSKPKASPQC